MAGASADTAASGIPHVEGTRGHALSTSLLLCKFCRVPSGSPRVTVHPVATCRHVGGSQPTLTCSYVQSQTRIHTGDTSAAQRVHAKHLARACYAQKMRFQGSQSTSSLCMRIANSHARSGSVRMDIAYLTQVWTDDGQCAVDPSSDACSVEADFRRSRYYPRDHPIPPTTSPPPKRNSAQSNYM